MRGNPPLRSVKCHYAMTSIYTDIHGIIVLYNILQQSECIENRKKNDPILIMTPEKRDKTLELSKHTGVQTQQRQEMK